MKLFARNGALFDFNPSCNYYPPILFIPFSLTCFYFHRDPKVAELKTILETNNQTVIVAHKNILNHKLEGEQRSCVVQYMLYSSWLGHNYPESKFVEVKCPSPACEYLKATSFVSFHFYANGVLLGKLDQGLDLQEYLTKPREFFASDD